MATTERSTDNIAEKSGEDVCCAKFDPARLDNREIVWENKPFVKDGVWCVYYMPLNFGSMMARAMGKIEAVGANCSDEDFLMLADMKSPWSSTVYFAVTKDDVLGAEMVKISGTFLTKVFEGPYKDFGKWVTEMERHVKAKMGEGFDVKCAEMFAYYATCPKCSKKYGKNYTVLFAKVA
uniref:Uncharacterized protein n=1 Tax=Trieres chinensis TaxID=1514140 RepID=A0A7S2EL24_TRICV|mmetsp:Transcript_28965/g.59278  ORF Transcript_28965/g.59278 Transcript_28965/m.59278 type:complete len:179 (+) Transcript_28965:89-625(+)